ncbi:MAG: peptide ABC transporter substrate-binding protein [Treponema sp.]|jgi:oligopeptide transport system substrate-binding protein|nr:peptide ABC transporter substrate-binding protein [Treponema sp.]
MKKKAFFLCPALILLFVLPGLPAQTSEDKTEPPLQEQKQRFDPAEQQEFIMVDSPHAYDFNPHTANYTNEAQLFTGLYEGLFSYDPYSLDPSLALAESYHTSRDKKIWTFTIRKNARFSNGDPITAESFRRAWLSLLDPETNAPFASLLDSISGIASYRTGQGKAEDVGIMVRDEYTLVLRLDMPTEHLPRILCHHAFSAVHPDPGVYSGAFVLEAASSGSVRLVKNENYHDSARVALPAITIRLSDDRDETAYLMNTGNAHWSTSNVNTEKLLDMETIKVFGEFATEYLFFKSDRFPWNQSDFRIALLTAVPWKELRSQSLVPAKTFIYPLMGYAAPEGFSDSDPEEAKMLLEQAKLEHGLSADQEMTIVFAISDTDYMKEMAKLLSDAWEKIGIKVDVQTTPVNRYLQSIETWQADLFSYIWIGDFADPVAFLELFRGDSSLNVSAWHNEEFNRLMNEAAGVSDSKKRYQLLSEAEAVLLNQGVVLPVSHPVSLNVIDLDAIGGWYTNALDIHPLKALYFTGKTEKIPNLVRKF